MKPVTIVLAGNHSQYSDWLYDNVLPKMEALNDYRYASHPDKVQGLVAEDVIVVGTFWDDFPEANEMYKLALSRVRNNPNPLTKTEPK